MAFSVGTFMGALVRSFDTSMNWNIGSPSQIKVNLVDDPTQGATFSPPDVGTPVYFQYEGFKFNGLFQRHQKTTGHEGNPVFSVDVVDPREILEGTQVIIGGYSGSIGGVNNLINAFGYWENIGGFGVALANDAGMPWHRIRDALLILCNTPGMTDFGGSLTYRGYQYGLDLSDVPVPPSYYRVGGVSVGLLEIISQICEDGHHDFFVELVGQTIKIRTANRFTQPPLGTISAVVDGFFGERLVRSSTGEECRNELTAAFLVGGDYTQLYLTDALTQFWGYDFVGNPVIGVPYIYNFFDLAGNLVQQVNTELMALNASPVSDIIGSLEYQCTTLEMRLSQVNYESWSMFVTRHRPDVAAVVGMTSPFRNNGVAAGAAAIRPLMVNDDKVMAKAAAQNAVAGDIHSREMRLYEFVRGYADEFYGKKFLARLPFILVTQDPDTLKIRTSYEVADGAYAVEGAAPLGLSILNEDVFKTQDGRFRAFVRFPNLVGADLSKISPKGTATETVGLFMECSANPQIVYLPAPAVVITLAGPLMDAAVDNVGDINILAAVLQLKPVDAQKYLKQAIVPLKVAPATRAPAAVALPLKSNILTYGPWYAQGAPGKVRFEQDPSLTPWTYGGYEAMNQAGLARVSTAITNMQVSEAADVEIEGAPTHSLGDVLEAGGPNITSMSVQCNQQGVTTMMRFQTFTPRFGTFSKGYVERLRKLSLTALELRKSIRSSLKEVASSAESIGNAARTSAAFMAKQANAHRRETPHDVLHSYSETETQEDGSLRTRTQVSALTMEEAVTMSNADQDSYHKATSVMSLSGLFRPFSTSPGGGSCMASYVLATTGGANRTKLDPWKAANDIEAWTWGNTYDGLHAYRRGGDFSNARPMGLRTPMVLVGWGHDVAGKCVPKSDTEDDWRTDTLYRQDLHKAGPMDPLWDEQRGVWTVHGSLKGTVRHIPAGGSGAMVIRPLSGPTSECAVWNYFSTAVGTNGNATDIKVITEYVGSDNRQYIVAADCV